jgi:hypothetical protein
VNGHIIAVGTATMPIIFQSDFGSNYWNGLRMYWDGTTNRFQYCTFMNSTNPAVISTWTGCGGIGWGPMYPEFLNCTFTNCPGAAIFAYTSVINYGGTLMAPTIRNCYFVDCFDGCFVNGESYRGQTYASPIVENNIFVNISGTAFTLYKGQSYADSSGVFANNAVVNAMVGVSSGVGCDIAIENNIFATNQVAVTRSDSLSANCSYNCFSGNVTNFGNYPATYGTTNYSNNNGTPCDIRRNIFQDPKFVATNGYTLQTNSPCIDAGNPAGAYLDIGTNTLGTSMNDIGPNGGPYAINWIIPRGSEGTTNFMLSARQYVGVTIHPSIAGRYRLDYTSDLVNGPWLQATNLALSTNQPYIYIDYDSPSVAARFYRGVLLP